ncbi:MAG: hypothetical protein ACI8RH_000627 [Flavobacteriales bacterium]
MFKLHSQLLNKLVLKKNLYIMKKNILFIALFICSSMVNAQDYLDILKVSHSQATLGNIDTDDETDVSNTNIELYLPIPITAKAVLLSGFTYENTRLGLNHSDSRSNLIMTRFNLGVKLNHGNKWSGTYVALPKLASDFNDLGADDFQMGGIALLEKKYSSRYVLKFGAYVSTENFGTTVTPIIGLWYKSKNSKFYVNATLPIRADVNYSLTNSFSLGANLLTSVKSYNLSEANSDFYVQEESIRFSAFAAYGFLDDMLILRARVGLDTTDYGVYNKNSNSIVQVLTAQIGDERARENSEFSAAPFVGLDLMFRVDL